MTEFTVHWCKSWDGKPVLRCGECPHPSTEALSINQRLEPRKRGGFQIAMDGSICMACGSAFVTHGGEVVTVLAPHQCAWRRS